MSTNHAWTRKQAKRSIVLMVVCIAASMTTGGAALIWIWSTNNWSIGRWLGLIGLFGFAGFVQIIWFVPVRRRVIRHGGRVCGRCLFVLKGLGDEGVCPECGEAFVIRDTMRGWEQDLQVTLREG